MSANEMLRAGADLIETMYKDKLAAVTALEARERALTATCIELQERIEELMPELQRRQEFAALQSKARDFAGRLERAGY